ncbi:MAG: GAF domain-containing sensor histidine kinase [Chitinophagaceae bacterium]|nr:GAF domain-containing sensor histidine kinase [Chitinophagaceae bacterium]
MSPSQNSQHEEIRLKKLHILDIVDSSPEKEFDDITKLAAQICQKPIAHITFIGSNQLFYKAKVGIEHITSSRVTSFCTHLIFHDEVMEVADALLDPRFEKNIWVTEPPFIRYYAGFPIKIDNYTVGALCVLDYVAGKLTKEQLFAMDILSNQVVKLLELRLTNKDVNQRILDSQHQQEHLQKLVRSQSKILSYVAHDVRNPLASLRGIIDLNERQLLSEAEGKNVMGLLKMQLDATLDTLTNVIEWGESQLKRQIPHIRAVDLFKVVSKKIKNFEVATQSKGNILQHNIEPGFQVVADEYLLRFILRNLLTNANKFTSNGTIIVSATRSANKALIQVKDNGIGISDKIFNKLFDPQNRVTNPGTENEKGTGMGLLLVKEFIEKLGSKLEVISKPGVGSEFSFSLPIPD